MTAPPKSSLESEHEAFGNPFCQHGLAQGDYQWRAYRKWQYFNKEGQGVIPKQRWLALREAKTRYVASDDWQLAFDMPKLKMSNLQSYEWSWSDNRFSTAAVTGTLDSWEPPYAEESFSAWAIDVHFARVGNDNSGQPTPAAPEPAAIERNKGGAPAKYDWERAVAAIVFAWADEGTWQPASQTEVKNKLADWFAAQEQHPSDSLLKDRARWLFEEFQRRASEASNLAA